MTEGDVSEEPPLATGDFSSWLTGMLGAIRGERGSDVPCGGCTACCTSSQYVHVGPDETETLSRIPAELLFPAPRLPPGHVLLGYDERGHCPMLIDNACSIYQHRPRTCRTYDCRIFPATGIGEEKVHIARRARRWQFSYPTQDDRHQHDAVRAAATFLEENRGLLPDGPIPTGSVQRAVGAIEVHAAFLRRDDETGEVVVADPGPAAVRAEMLRARRSGGGLDRHDRARLDQVDPDA